MEWGRDKVNVGDAVLIDRQQDGSTIKKSQIDLDTLGTGLKADGIVTN